MKSLGFDTLKSEVSTLQSVFRLAKVSKITRGLVFATGISDVAALGEMVEFQTAGEAPVLGEIVLVEREQVGILPDGQVDGLQIDDQIKLTGNNDIYPHESWIGRVIDPFGNSLDDGPLLRGASAHSLQGVPINPTIRRPLGPRMETGLTVFNTLLPIVRGQRIGLFAGSGVGKSTLLAKLTMGIEADIVVIAMIGERGREVNEFVTRVLGKEGMKRAIVVATTSDQSALVRRRCAWTAMAIAEHFRDHGRQVLFVADSITRFAEAHREVALAAGETSALRGFPPSTTHLITSLCERAGPGVGETGDITAIFSVLVAGSDMDEPIADILRGVLDGHVVLDREIAERGRFPAINLLRSVSRALPLAASEDENKLIACARARLGAYEKSEMMIQAGLYSAGSDANIDAAISAWPLLDEFMSKTEKTNTNHSFEMLAKCF